MQRNLNGKVAKMKWVHGDGRRTHAMHIGSHLSCSLSCAALKQVSGPLNPSLSDSRPVWDKTVVFMLNGTLFLSLTYVFQLRFLYIFVF